MEVKIEPVLKLVLILSTILETVVIIPVTKLVLPPTFQIVTDVGMADVDVWAVIIPVLLGLWSGLFIGIRRFRVFCILILLSEYVFLILCVISFSALLLDFHVILGLLV